MALAQYHRMEKTLSKIPDLKAQYNQVLQEYLDFNHMEETSPYEPHAEKKSSFFLLHYAVVKPESKTNQVRVVFDGFSLNDVLYSAPILQADMIKIILGWGKYKFVVTGDIQKMYRQILINQDDRTYKKLLLPPSQNDKIKTFQLKTVTFGINCAPFLDIRTLKQLSAD